MMRFIMNFLNRIPLSSNCHSQNTINEAISFSGIGIHNGKPVSMKLIPAQENTGIVFKRIDLKNNNLIKVNNHNTIKSKYCSSLKNESGVVVSTVEHLLASLNALSIDNLTIEINAPELPAMDGSAHEYTSKILEVGKKKQNQQRNYIKIKKNISITLDNRWIKVTPSNQLKLELKINYPGTLIGKHKYIYVHNEDNFVNDICYARTFALAKNVDKLKASGFGIGGNLNNAIVVGKNKILNNAGLRCKKEFVKHKVLDCLGDFFLSGFQIIGNFQAQAPGHELNLQIINEIFKSNSNYEIIRFNDLNSPSITNQLNITNYKMA